MKNKWFHITKECEENDEFLLDKKQLETPFEYLPQEEILTNTELDRLKELESEENGFKDGREFYEMIKLQYRLGPDIYFHNKRRKHLNSIISKCSNLNIKLPDNFAKLMNSDKLVSRLRLGFGEIDLSDGVAPFDNGEDTFIITFIKDSQGCRFWYLMVDKCGSHKILYNPHHWSNQDKEIISEDDAHFEYFICASSIEEFIVRLSYEIKIKERQD